MRITWVLFGLALLLACAHSDPAVKREAETEDLNPLNEVRATAILFDEATGRKNEGEGGGGRRKEATKSRGNHAPRESESCLFPRFIILPPLARIRARCSSSFLP